MDLFKLSEYEAALTCHKKEEIIFFLVKLTYTVGKISVLKWS